MDLSVTSLSVSLGKRRVLKGIDAVFRPRRVTTILGANGSGKSTLMRTLAGLISGDAGGVGIGGRGIAGLEPRERARRIGYLPQDATVHWDVTAATLVALGRLPHRSPFANSSVDDDAAVWAAMIATGTEEFAERPVSQLSGGERARVLLARVLAGAPEWLLADEPLASLDPVHQLDQLDQLRRLAAQGMGVVIVLHDLVQAARAADDVLLLRDGEVVAFGPAQQALTPDTLRLAFGVEVMMVEDASGRMLPVPIGRTPD